MAASVVQTTFAAISFAGAGYLFKLFDKNGYEAEMKRHNKALEDLANSKEKFYEEEVRQRDKIERIRQKLRDANLDINDTNDALKQLHDYEQNRAKLTAKLYGSAGGPKLDNFYKPSSEMADYQMIVVGLIGIPVGYLVYKAIP